MLNPLEKLDAEYFSVLLIADMTIAKLCVKLI